MTPFVLFPLLGQDQRDTRGQQRGWLAPVGKCRGLQVIDALQSEGLGLSANDTQSVIIKDLMNYLGFKPLRCLDFLLEVHLL